MIKKLHLKNFKSHRDTELNIKALTLISGVNNIGKSSILQSLLLLRQTFKKGLLEKGLDLNKPLVSIGVGNDALYKLAATPFLTIELNTDNADYSFVYQINDDTTLDASFIPIYEESVIPVQNDTNTQGTPLSKSLFGSDFQYLSASRWAGTSDFPIASYEVNSERQISLEYGQGELLGNFLYAYKGEPTFNYIGGVGDEPIGLLDQVIYWERLISTGITIDVQKKPDNTGFRIIYGSKGTEGKKSIEGFRAENIGYGVSYSLSVVTALLSAKPGALIMIENPEAHLHPEGQAELARLMCLVAQRGIQVMVETHSDHIINGVLVNCKRFEKEGRGIDRENVSMYYFSGQDENHAVVYEEVKIMSDGNVEYQPKGFFDRIEKDIDYLLGE